jgi:soluble lytic murein transglycosylase-like protein
MAKKSATNSNSGLITALALAAGAVVVANMMEEEKLTLAAKLNRNISFTENKALAGAPEGKPVTEIKLPMVSSNFYTQDSIPAVKDSLDSLESRFGKIIEVVSKLTNVPYELILSLIFIESNGNAKAVSSVGATGLMQLIPSTATSVVALENIKKRLTQGEKDYLRVFLGSRLDCILKMRDMGTPVNCGDIKNNAFISQSDMFNPGLNIMCGAIFLGILMDEHKEDNTFRLDKVAIRYNKGYFFGSRGKTIVGSPAQVLAKYTGETAAFIKKLVGVNGLLSIIG